MPNRMFYLMVEAPPLPGPGITAALHSTYRITPAGALDTSWAARGVYSSSFHLDPATVAVQPNGDLLMPSSASFEGLPDLLKLSVTGTPVVAFGTDGIAKIVVREASNDCALYAEPQSTGSVVVAGTSDSDEVDRAATWTLACFTNSGALDASFGRSGLLCSPLGIAARNANNVPFVLTAILPDDKIAVFNGENVARLERDGIPDRSFGGNATGVITVSKPVSVVYSLDGDSSGRITTIGGVYIATMDGSSSSAITVARYTVSGTLERAFGIAGTLNLTSSYQSEIQAVNVARSGQIAVLARERLATSSVTKLTVWNAVGQPDFGFGFNGVLTISVLPTLPAEHARVLALGDPAQPQLTWLTNGALLVSNISLIDSPYADTSVIRLTTAGQWDASYGVNGVSQLGANARVWFVDENGRVYFFHGANTPDASYRLDATGRVDRTFGFGGRNMFAFQLTSARPGYQAGIAPALFAPRCGTGDFRVHKLSLQRFDLHRMLLPIVAQQPALNLPAKQLTIPTVFTTESP
jgi:uncharacterized delta-60 repeat protein